MASKFKNVSSDGVPNRKGGSWPNHPSMRYELPIPFTPCGPPSDAYRDGWDRVFGPREQPAEVPTDPAEQAVSDPGHYHVEFPEGHAEDVWTFTGPCWCTK